MASPNRPARPNIILILPDQLRRDMCGPYGEAPLPTPGIDRLAAEGLVFDQAISPCPVCTPYRGMLMTGRFPTHSGVVNNFVETSPLQNPAPLAAVLADAGYDTAYIGKWHLAPGEYGAPSEHPSFVPPGADRLGFRYWRAFNFHMDFSRYWYYDDEPVRRNADGYETDVVFRQAIEYLEARRDSDRPLFLVVSPHPPHPPFGRDDAPPGYLDSIPATPPQRGNVPKDNPRSVAEMRVYLAMVRNLDDNVATFTQYLDSTGWTDSSLVIFTSDHGEMHGSHGRVNKMVPYAEALDVPLIVRGPGIPRGTRSGALLGPMDYLPTLATFAETTPGMSCDGVDLSQVLRGEESGPDRPMLIMNYSSHWNYFRSDTPDTAADWRCWPEWRGVRTRQFTYVLWLTGTEELYDNAADPLQLENRVGDPAYAENLTRFRTTLAELLQTAHDEFPPGTAYADWFDEHRRLVRTSLGPVEARHGAGTQLDGDPGDTGQIDRR